MLKDLVKLANFFDEKKMLREANIIDIFIHKIAQVNLEPDFNVPPKVSEPTWQEDKTEQSFESDPSMIEEPTGSIQLPNGVQINLENHPLGKKIMNYLKDVFHIADSGTASDVGEGVVSVRMIRDIIQTAFKYTEELELYHGQGQNPNPISPELFRQILFEAMRIYSQKYQTVGFLDNFEIREAVYNLFQHYQDRYVDNYLDENYQYNYPEQREVQNPYGSPSGIGPELTPSQRDELWRRNEVENLPDTYHSTKEDPNEQRIKLKQRYPEKYHHILFDR